MMDSEGEGTGREARMTQPQSPTAALEGLPAPKVDHIDLVTVKLPFPAQAGRFLGMTAFGAYDMAWNMREGLNFRSNGSKSRGRAHRPRGP